MDITSVLGGRRSIDLEDVPTMINSDKEDVEVLRKSDAPKVDLVGTKPFECDQHFEKPCSPPIIVPCIPTNPCEPDSSNSSKGRKKQHTKIVDDSTMTVMRKKKPSHSCIEASLPKHMKKSKIFLSLLKEIGDSKEDHN